MMKIIFFDTETTDLGPSGRLIQFAYYEKGADYNKMFNNYYKAPVPISIEAMTIHHIKPRDIEDKPVFIKSAEYHSIKSLFENPEHYTVAHNASFDVEMLKREEIEPAKVIDTLKLAHKLDAEGKLPSKSLQYLRYALNLDDDTNKEIIPHDAKSDVIILHLLFERLYSKMSGEFETEKEVLDAMVKISSEPVFIQTFNFGKYNGKKVTDVAVSDRGYLKWLLDQKEQQAETDSREIDWVYTLKHALGK